MLAAASATLALILVLPLEPLLGALLVLWIGLAAWDSYRKMSAARELVLDEVVDGSFVAPWLTIVRSRPKGAWFDRTLVVLPDMLDADAFRELRLRLRWE